jgi:hypothetical protein
MIWGNMQNNDSLGAYIFVATVKEVNSSKYED